MTTAAQSMSDAPVYKTIVVKTSAERAFRAFTRDIDSWWPRSHHIGKSPMKKVVLEGAAGGRCYSEHADGTQCDWGTVLVWEPPRRLVIGWQITHEWSYEPDLARSSEVEIRFEPQPDGSTRVDLEHRLLGRHGPGAAAIRTAVDSPNGWTGVLRLFAARAEERRTEERRAPEEPR